MQKPELDRSCGCDSADAKTAMVPVEQARAHAISLVSPVSNHDLVELGVAAGRVARHDICAPRAMPFFNNSAVDGFAIRSADLNGDGPWQVDIVGTVGAGDEPVPMNNTHRAGAWRILTGAPVPEGFDAAVMQENCLIEDDRVTINQHPRPGLNIRHRGSDVERNSVLVSSGTRLQSRHLGLLAANGYGAVNVFAKPRVAVFSTGDELVEPGAGITGSQIYDSNRAMLIAMAEQAGAEVIDYGVVGDDQNSTAELLQHCCGRHDMVLTSGAVSVGDRDHLKPAFEQIGGKTALWRVAVKPGKPVMLGTCQGTVLTALPGNPLAVFVGFKLFVAAQLSILSGQNGAWSAGIPAVAGFDWERKTGREEYFPVSLCQEREGTYPVLQRLGNGGSGSLYALGQADGLGMVNADNSRINKGDAISWFPFSA